MISHLRNDLQAITADIKTKLNSNNSELEADLEKKTKEIQHFEKKCEDLICKVDEKTNLIKSLEMEKTETESNVDSLKIQLASECKSRTELSANLETKETLIKDLQRELKNTLLERKNSKAKDLEMFEEEKASLERKASEESKDLADSLKETQAKLAAKESE